MKSNIAVLLLVLSFTVAARAQSFTPDPVFNGGAGARVGFGLAADEARAVAVQPDGKILVFAYAYLNNGVAAHAALLRYDADGSIDMSFGRNGQVALPRPYEGAHANFRFAGRQNNHIMKKAAGITAARSF
jgi:hypothetical protein